MKETGGAQTRSTPSVSVVIPAYNVAPYIAETLNSVFAQTFTDFEVIVVDDGSTDDTPRIARKHEVKLISTPHRGLSMARNTGLEAATGQIIAYTIHPLHNGGGMATHEDITEREELSARLKERNFQFDIAINNMSHGLCFFDADHRLRVCNARYIDMYGLSSNRVGPGTPLAEILDMRFEAGSVPAMTREEYANWRTGVAISAEATDSIVEMRNGRTFKIRHRPMPDLGWVATHEDITEQRKAELQIAHMAHHDALTDLANRALLGQRRCSNRTRCSPSITSTSTSSRPSTTRWATRPATSCCRMSDAASSSWRAQATRSRAWAAMSS